MTDIRREIMSIDDQLERDHGKGLRTKLGRALSPNSAETRVCPRSRSRSRSGVGPRRNEIAAMVVGARRPSARAAEAAKFLFDLRNLV
jgi:hypothetical protein